MGKEQPTLRGNSRKYYENNNPTYESLQTGSLMRIADSVEQIARNKKELEDEIERLKKDVEWYKVRYNSFRDAFKRMQHSRNGLKGYVAKLKKKIESKK